MADLSQECNNVRFFRTIAACVRFWRPYPSVSQVSFAPESGYPDHRFLSDPTWLMRDLREAQREIM